MNFIMQFDDLEVTTAAETCRTIPVGGVMTGKNVTLSLPFRPNRYYRHGWQSWSLTAWTSVSQPVPQQRPAILHPLQTDPFYASDPRHNGSWLGAVEAPDGRILLLGALGLDAHVALSGDQLTGWYESDGGEWFAGFGAESVVFAEYAKLLGKRFGKGRFQRPPRVWCSWYSLYKEIDERRLLEILKALGDLPFDVFQIDDGWQRKIGDWEPNDKFQSGMTSMAESVQATGRKAGLWLAPLLVVPSSQIYKNHKEWLLHDTQGRLVSAGHNWGEPLYAIDTTHPTALDWLKALMGNVRGWGYDYLKLDFLYAGGLPGKRYAEMTRETAYRTGLEVIRKALGDAYFLACGTPILPALGLCDGMRIGPDVASEWDNMLYSLLLNNFTTPGGRNAIRTACNRLWLKPLVNTDPDVVFFRDRNNSLTSQQRAMLQDLAQITDFKATSDPPRWLSDSEKETLRFFLMARPQVERTGRYTFKIDSRIVDFSDPAALPSPSGFMTRLAGMLAGWLSNSKWVLNIFNIFTDLAVRYRIGR
jgi:alpha-galactosidase